MLGVGGYEKAYIASCRAQVDAQIGAFEKVAAAHKGSAALGALEHELCRLVVLALEGYFVHRLRGKEGKDGNPCNEVRLLAASIMAHDGKLCTDKQIKLNPEKSVLGLKPGDEVRLKLDDLKRLVAAYFAEITKKFS